MAVLTEGGPLYAIVHSHHYVAKVLECFRIHVNPTECRDVKFCHAFLDNVAKGFAGMMDFQFIAVDSTVNALVSVILQAGFAPMSEPGPYDKTWLPVAAPSVVLGTLLVDNATLFFAGSQTRNDFADSAWILHWVVFPHSLSGQGCHFFFG